MIEIALAVSLLVNGAVVVGMIWAFRNRPDVARSFMQGAQEQMRSFFEEFRVRPGDIVFVGDSITAGARWPEVFPGRPVRNRGINGDTTTGVLERLGPIVGGRPDTIFLMIGSNDLGLGRSVDETVDNIEEIVRRIRLESPRTRIVLQSVLPRERELAEDVSRLNDGIRSVAFRSGLAYVDLVRAFADESGQLRRELTNDGLHLLGPGYALWAELVRDLLPPGPPPPARSLGRSRDQPHTARG